MVLRPFHQYFSHIRTMVGLKATCNETSFAVGKILPLAAGSRSAVGSASDSRARGPGFDTLSGNMLSDSRRTVVRYR